MFDSCRTTLLRTKLSLARKSSFELIRLMKGSLMYSSRFSEVSMLSLRAINTLVIRTYPQRVIAYEKNNNTSR